MPSSSEAPPWPPLFGSRAVAWRKKLVLERTFPICHRPRSEPAWPVRRILVPVLSLAPRAGGMEIIETGPRRASRIVVILTVKYPIGSRNGVPQAIAGDLWSTGGIAEQAAGCRQIRPSHNAAQRRSNAQKNPPPERGKPIGDVTSGNLGTAWADRPQDNR